MIERKRGHIVGISSICAKSSIPGSVTYVATKYGNDGFMDALYDDMCWQGHDDYIKLTTVYPGPIATQKNLQKLFDSLSGIPMFDPSLVGESTVSGIQSKKISHPAIPGDFNDLY
jgi:short-subunit dehydrogenase